MTISLRRANEFWEIVLACLVELFEVPEVEARRRVSYVFQQTANLKLDLSDPEWLSELIYHTEELNLAADLARKEVPAGDAFRARYSEIVMRYAHAPTNGQGVAFEGYEAWSAVQQEVTAAREVEEPESEWMRVAGEREEMAAE